MVQNEDNDNDQAVGLVSLISNTQDNVKKKFSTSKYFLTGIISGGFFVLGFSLTVFGVALPTLAENMRLTNDDVSPALIMRGAGYMFGSLVFGLLERRIQITVLFMISLCLMGFGLLFTPLILNPVALYFFVTVSACGMGACETIGTVACLRLWGEKADPVLQFVHFWYCLGSAVTPLIMKPYLNEAPTDDHAGCDFNGTKHETAFEEVAMIRGTDIPYLGVPFIIVSSFNAIIVSLLLLYMYCLPVEIPKVEDSKESEGRKFRYTMLALLFLFFFFYMGSEISFVIFLYSFGLCGLGLSKDMSAYLSFVLYGAVVVGQFFAIFMAKFFRPIVILACDVSGMTISALVLILLPYYIKVSAVIFWVGVAGAGVFCASIYGTTFLWADDYITMNGSAASVLIIGASFGEMVLPIPIGQLITSSPMMFLYLITAYVVAMLLMLLGMVKFASNTGPRTESNSENEDTSKNNNLCENKDDNAL